jgi:hypothetical protein
MRDGKGLALRARRVADDLDRADPTSQVKHLFFDLCKET